MEIAVDVDNDQRLLEVDATMQDAGMPFRDAAEVRIDRLRFSEDDPVAPGEKVPDDFFMEYEDQIYDRTEEHLIEWHNAEPNMEDLM